MHIVPPLLPNSPRMDAEVMPGKRSAWCDLTNPVMQEQFWKLVKGADVRVNSFLHLDRKGVSPQQLAAVKPGIICVEIPLLRVHRPLGRAGRVRTAWPVRHRVQCGRRRHGRSAHSADLSAQ